ncbi:MAG: hypothetical protein HAW62_03145 [Endozoicomonadaceae bacterium]|nr:hypothetical protein [Endozoicomonadaceae bacterium]
MSVASPSKDKIVDVTPNLAHSKDMKIERIATIPLAKELPVTLLDCDPAGWLKLLHHIPLTGVEKTLAMHCALAQVIEDALYLTLDATYDMLLNSTHAQRISIVLSEYFHRKITVKISAGKIMHETAIMQIERMKKACFQVAKSMLLEDPNVKSILTLFDAKFDENLIDYELIS